MIFLCENVVCEVQAGAWKQGGRGLDTRGCSLPGQNHRERFPAALSACWGRARDEGRGVGAGGPSALSGRPHTPREGTWSSRRGQGHTCLTPVLTGQPSLPWNPAASARRGLLMSTCPDLLPGNFPLPGSASATSPTCSAPRALTTPQHYGCRPARHTVTRSRK